MKKYSVYKAGIGLLELMLALAIIAVMLVGATRYYATTRSNQQLNDAVAMLETLTGAAENWYWTYGTFAQGDNNGLPPAISMVTLLQRGLVPSTWWPNGKRQITNAQPSNAWGGEVSIAQQNNATNEVAITLTSLPAADCLNLTEIRAQQQGVSPITPCPVDQTQGGYDYTEVYTVNAAEEAQVGE